MTRESLASEPDAAPAHGEHRWYYRSAGRTHGPIDTEQLLRDARRGLLTDAAEVRLGDDGEWVRAGTLDGLVPHSPKSDAQGERRDTGGPGRPSAELSRVVAECRAYLLQQDVRRAGQSKRNFSPPQRSLAPAAGRLAGGLAAGISTVGNAVVGLLSAIGAGVAALLPSLDTANRFVHSRVVWGMAGGGVLTVASLLIYENATRQRRQAESVDRLAAEFREMRERSADDDAWLSYSQRVRNRLDELVPELEEAAHAGDRTSIDLLWAARDFLPKMLIDARDAPSDAERQFEVCMRRVRAKYGGAQR